jgi:CheY-like chemotaxis protein
LIWEGRDQREQEYGSSNGKWLSTHKEENGMDLKKAEKIIRGRKVIIVDDEKDVLDTLTDLLQVCKIDQASSFEDAKALLETEEYEVAILDIMGVNGYKLLEIAKSKKVAALMLTAHALSEADLRKSAEGGASYYAPKEEIDNIAIFVADVIEAVDQGKSAWVRMLERLGGYYDRRFGGTDWREKQKEFLMSKLRPME